MKKLLSEANLFFAIKIMVILLPLFFIVGSPTQLGADNYTKYFLLGVFAFLAVVSFVLVKKKEGKITLVSTAIDKPLIILMSIAFLAGLMGVSRIDSFFGNLSSTGLPFFSLFFFCLLYFLFVNIFNTNEKRLAILKYLLYIFPIVSLVSFIVVYFYASHRLSVYLRLAAGTAEDMSMYLVLFIILLFSIYSSEVLKGALGILKKTKYLFDFSAILAVFVLLKVDFHYAWWLLLFGMVFVIISRMNFSVKSADADADQKSKLSVFRKKYFTPTLLLFISINFLLNFYLVYGQVSLEKRLVQYRQLTNAQSFELAGETIKHNLFFGVGLENFDYAFSKYRNPEMNNQAFWDIRYNKAGSFFLDIVIACGLLGTISMLYLVFVYVKNILGSIKTDIHNDDKDKNLRIVLVPLALSLPLALLMYSGNANIFFLLVIISALFFSTYLSSSKFEYIFANDNKNRPYPIFIFGIFMLAGIIYFAFSVKYLLADFDLGTSTRSENSLRNAANLSPGRYQHNLNLAKYYLKKTEILNNERRIDESLEMQSKSLDYLHKAEEVGANSVVAQESAGVIYRTLSEGGDGLNLMSIKAFEKAKTLEPSNPVLFSELGQAELKSGDFEAALQNFQKAIELKTNYLQAEFGQAKALLGLGKRTEAMEMLTKLAKDSGDANVYYELGLAYFNDEKYKESIVAFNSAITLSPLHSNALYGLASAYEKNRDTEQAIFYLKKVQKMNPNNMDVAEKIKMLEK